MEHKKSISVVFATALALALLIGAYAFAPSSPETDDPMQKAIRNDIGRIRMGIDVIARTPNGTVTGEYHNGDDLMTKQMAQFLTGFFCDDLTSSNFNLPGGGVNDTGGTSRNLQARTTTHGSSGNWNFLSTYTGAGTGGYIVIGNSTTAPKIIDNKAISPVGSPALLQNCTYSNGNVTMVATIVNDATQTNGISEACLYYYNGVYGGYACCFRETFTAIPCSIGDTITVVYTLQLANTGFTDNFGEVIEAMWTYAPNGGTITSTLTDVNGVAQAIYTKSQGNNILWDADIDTVNCDGIIVGNGSTPIARTDYNLANNLTTNITSNNPPTITYGATTSNVTFTSNITLGANYNITEAGWFCKSRNTAGTICTTMFWRVVFAQPYSYTANDVMSVTFVVVG